MSLNNTLEEAWAMIQAPWRTETPSCRKLSIQAELSAHNTAFGSLVAAQRSLPWNTGLVMSREQSPGHLPRRTVTQKHDTSAAITARQSNPVSTGWLFVRLSRHSVIPSRRADEQNGQQRNWHMMAEMSKYVA